MCRIVILFFALTALVAVSAHGAPDSAAKTHGKALSGTRTAHRETDAWRRHTPAGSRRLRASASSHRLHSTAVERDKRDQPTPQEVGRAAGLKIRRELEQRRWDRLLAERREEHDWAVRREAEGSRARAADRAAYSEEMGRREASEREAAWKAAERREPPSALAEARVLEADDRANSATMAALRAQTVEAALRMAREGSAPPLKGSLASLERQDERLQAEGLQRILNDADLAARIKHELLAPVPASAALTVNPGLPPLRRYCRPWTAQFLADLARAHEAVFHRPLEVESAVRPVSYQERLMRINGNAAPAQGAIVSPHETGAAVDIGKKGMSWRELEWMRRRLLALELVGKIDVEEEFEQACFHITVYKNYMPQRQGQRPERARTGPAKSRRLEPANAVADAIMGQGQ
jgi:hypothetical protein